MNAAAEITGKHPPPKVTEQISFLRTIPRASATWKLCLLLQKRWISLIRTAFIWWGESYGGIVVEFCAVNHPNDVKGLLLVSTGLSDAVLGIQAQEETHHGILTKYVPDDPYQYILGYPGAVLFICGDADATGAYDNAAFNAVLYQQREQPQTDFVTIPDGGHGYGTFTKEQKQTTVDCILSWMAQ